MLGIAYLVKSVASVRSITPSHLNRVICKLTFITSFLGTAFQDQEFSEIKSQIRPTTRNRKTESIVAQESLEIWIASTERRITQPVKTDLDKKLLPNQKTIQTLNIDAQGFRKTKNENPPTWEIGVNT